MGEGDMNWMSGSKGGPFLIVGGRFVHVKRKMGKATPAVGQKALVAAWRQDRAERVKLALSAASSRSPLFKDVKQRAKLSRFRG